MPVEMLKHFRRLDVLTAFRTTVQQDILDLHVMRHGRQRPYLTLLGTCAGYLRLLQ
jgi:hypothetical protein